MTSSSDSKPASTELTGGAGFSYEDTVVAYYLSSLLRRERATGQTGLVMSVAIQQQGHGNPMDDLVVEFDDAGTKRVLSLQIKRSVTISGAPTNDQFRGIITAAVTTQALTSFNKDVDVCGFVVEHVAADPFRSMTRLIDWARAGTSGADFEARFLPTGNAAASEQNLRSGLLPVIGATNVDEEVGFYRHFVALHLHGLEEGGLFGTEVINRLKRSLHLMKTARMFCCSIVFAELPAKGLADIAISPRDVRFTPDSGHSSSARAVRLLAARGRPLAPICQRPGKVCRQR